MTNLEAFNEAARRHGYKAEEIQERNKEVMKVFPFTLMQELVPTGQEEAAVMRWMDMFEAANRLTPEQKIMRRDFLMERVKKRDARN